MEVITVGSENRGRSISKESLKSLSIVFTWSLNILRNALAFAARTESPYVNKHIADLLSTSEAILDVQKIVETIENNDVPF